MSINACAFTISNTPGTSGDFTVSAADTGAVRVPGASHDGAICRLFIREGTSFEIRSGAVYTHSGTSMSRGTLEDSSDSLGAAINFTSAAIVTVIGWYDTLSDRAMLGAPNVNQTITSQKFICSGHLTINNSSSTAAATVANRLYMMPFKLEVAGIFDALAIRCGTGVAASNARMGLYAINSSGHPGDLLRETSAQATTTSGTDVIGTITEITLQPGWYYVAVVTDSTPALGRGDVGGSLPNLMGQASGNLMSANGSFYASHTFGALPNPAPTTSLTTVLVGTAAPTVLLRRKA